MNIIGFANDVPTLTPAAATFTSGYSVINTTPLREFDVTMRLAPVAKPVGA